MIAKNSPLKTITNRRIRRLICPRNVTNFVLHFGGNRVTISEVLLHWRGPLRVQRTVLEHLSSLTGVSTGQIDPLNWISTLA